MAMISANANGDTILTTPPVEWSFKTLIARNAWPVTPACRHTHGVFVLSNESKRAIVWRTHIPAFPPQRLIFSLPDAINNMLLLHLQPFSGVLASSIRASKRSHDLSSPDPLPVVYCSQPKLLQLLVMASFKTEHSLTNAVQYSLSTRRTMMQSGLRTTWRKPFRVMRTGVPRGRFNTCRKSFQTCCRRLRVGISLHLFDVGFLTGSRVESFAIESTT